MVGDVSDKGIPAALFMAQTITLAKALAPRAQTPRNLLRLLNLELCRCAAIGVLYWKNSWSTRSSMAIPRGHGRIRILLHPGPDTVTVELIDDGTLIACSAQAPKAMATPDQPGMPMDANDVERDDTPPSAPSMMARRRCFRR